MEQGAFYKLNQEGSYVKVTVNGFNLFDKIN
jgi:hypothetical protein